ncbi:MAG: DUF1554 domain-containing protein [Acidobacteriota bacterium]
MSRHAGSSITNALDYGLLMASCWLAASPLLAEPRVAFVTSERGNSIMSTWPSSDGLAGLDGADRVCQNLATAAGLDQPEDFVAWLSDSTADAYCRVHGLTGGMFDPQPCGQPELPTFAGPWLRTDGTPLMPSSAGMLPDGPMWVPLWHDENGDLVLEQGVFTGSNVIGPNEIFCDDWMTTSGTVITGSTFATTLAWNQNLVVFCSELHPIYCFQTGAGDPVPAPNSSGRTMFLTASRGTANLSSWPGAGGLTGRAAADAICQSDATAGGLANPDSYRAWLSDSLMDARDAIVGDGAWVRLDGQLIAANNADLLDGMLEAPINVRSDGVYNANAVMWTGTNEDGTAAPARCSDWTSSSAAELAEAGTANHANGWWTRFPPSDLPCDLLGRLYCLSNVDLSALFDDGFESGDTTAWSSTTP